MFYILIYYYKSPGLYTIKLLQFSTLQLVINSNAHGPNGPMAPQLTEIYNFIPSKFRMYSQ